MKTISAILSLPFFLSFISTVSYAKEWHGIIPLHSSRADVERLLGPPADRNNELVSIHKLEHEVVFIVYATGPPCGTDGPSAWQVPRGTVLSITVRSRTELRLSDLKIDQKKYKKTGGGHVPDVFYYTNDEEGVSIEVVQGKVTGITYEPAAKDEYLRCPGSRNKQNAPCR
jgi:hypothetical protein